MAPPGEDRPVFTPDDDGFHGHLASGEWWFTETSWFSFHHPERRLGGWFYTMVRHAPGTVAGGTWVWDDTAHLPWEVLYSSNLTATQLPPDADLRHVALPTGVSIDVVVPTLGYHLGYDDPGRFVADLTFTAQVAPRPLPGDRIDLREGRPLRPDRTRDRDDRPARRDHRHRLVVDA